MDPSQSISGDQYSPSLGHLITERDRNACVNLYLGFLYGIFPFSAFLREAGFANFLLGCLVWHKKMQNGLLLPWQSQNTATSKRKKNKVKEEERGRRKRRKEE